MRKNIRTGLALSGALVATLWGCGKSATTEGNVASKPLPTTKPMMAVPSGDASQPRPVAQGGMKLNPRAGDGGLGSRVR